MPLLLSWKLEIGLWVVVKIRVNVYTVQCLAPSMCHIKAIPAPEENYG